MIFSRDKMILYMLIIASGIDFILPWPIFSENSDSKIELEPSLAQYKPRLSRQVVQPTWLNTGQEPPTDPTVYVNQRALEEAEEIRRTIQKAVDDDRYAVADQPINANIENLPTFTPSDATPPPPANEFPKWYLNMQKLWKIWSSNLFRSFYH